MAVIPRDAAGRVKRIVELPRFVYAPVMTTGGGPGALYPGRAGDRGNCFDRTGMRGTDSQGKELMGTAGGGRADLFSD